MGVSRGAWRGDLPPMSGVRGHSNVVQEHDRELMFFPRQSPSPYFHRQGSLLKIKNNEEGKVAHSYRG
jgi:hypothetical protein